MRAGIVAWGALCALVLALTGCIDEGDKEVLPPVVLGMLDTAEPTYDDGEEQIFQVSAEIRLPFRKPSDGERPNGQADPYPRPPFHVASDSRITLRFTLSNLDDKQHTVELLVDPWNEFVRYVPGVVMDEEEAIPNFSGIDRYFVLPPKGRIEGIITPDDMVELAVDLGTAMALEKTPPDGKGAFGGPALYNRAFNFQNRSSEPDPVLEPYLPRGPVATIVGFDLGLRTAEKAKIAVELVIDVEDLNGDRVVEDGDEAKLIGRPGKTLTPPAAEMN
jgi:hypothetical protein